jgi:hypothetical protein
MIVKIVKELIISMLSIMLIMLVIVRIYIIQLQIQMDIKINGIINYINNLSYLIPIKISIIK